MRAFSVATVLLAAFVALAAAQSLTIPEFSTNSRIKTELNLLEETTTILMHETTLATSNFDGSSEPMTLVKAIGPEDFFLSALIQGDDKITYYQTGEGCKRLGGSSEDNSTEEIAFIPESSEGALDDFEDPKREFYYGFRDLIDNNDLSGASFVRKVDFRGITCNLFRVENVQKRGSAYNVDIWVPDFDWTSPGSDSTTDRWIAAVELDGIVCESINETCEFSNSSATNGSRFHQFYNFFAYFEFEEESPSLDLGLLAFCPLFTSSSSSSSTSATIPKLPLIATAKVLVTNVGEQSSVLTWEAWDVSSGSGSGSGNSTNQTLEVVEPKSKADFRGSGWIVKTNEGFSHQTIFAVNFANNVTFALDSSLACNETDSSNETLSVEEGSSENLFDIPDVVRDSNYAKRLLSSSPLRIRGLVDLFLIANELNLTYNGERDVRGIRCNTWFASFDVPILDVLPPPSTNTSSSSSAVVAPSSSASAIASASSSVVAGSSSAVAVSASSSVALPTAVATATVSVTIPVGSSIRQVNETEPEIKARKYLLIFDSSVTDWSFSHALEALESSPVRFQLLELAGGSDSNSTNDVASLALAWESDEISEALEAGVISNHWIYDIYSISSGLPSNHSVSLPPFSQCPYVVDVKPTVNETEYYPELVASFISFVELLDTVDKTSTFIQSWYTNLTDALRFSFYDNLDLSVAKIIDGADKRLYTLTPTNASSSCSSSALDPSLDPFLPADEAQANSTSPGSNSTSVDLYLQELTLIFGRLDLVQAQYVGKRWVRGIPSDYWLGFVRDSRLWYGFYYVHPWSGSGSNGSSVDESLWVPFRIEVSQFEPCSGGSVGGAGLCSSTGYLEQDENARSYSIHRIYDFVGLTHLAAIPATVIKPPVCFPPPSSNSSSSVIASPTASASAVLPSVSEVVTVSVPVSASVWPSLATDIPETRRRAAADNQKVVGASNQRSGFGLGAVLGIAASALLVGAAVGGAVLLRLRRRQRVQPTLLNSVSLS